MHPETIQNHLLKACQLPHLTFQVIEHGPCLYIYINYPAEQPLEQESLSTIIHQAIAQLQLPHIQQLALYSRVLGVIEPDWEKSIELAAQPSSTPQPNQEIPEEEMELKAEEISSIVEAIESSGLLSDSAHRSLSASPQSPTSEEHSIPELSVEDVSVEDLVAAFEESQSSSLRPLSD